MSGQSNQNYGDGARAGRQAASSTGRAASTAGRAGRRAGKAGRKGASTAKGAASAGKAAVTAARGTAKAVDATTDLIPGKLTLKLVIALVLIAILLFVMIFGGGTSSSSMDPTVFFTADEAEQVNAPENEEELSSVYTRKQSLDQTVKLAAIIEEAKMEDRSRVEEELQKKYEGKNLTIECDSDTAPTFICDDIDGYGTPYEGLGGEEGGGSELGVSSGGKSTNSQEVIDGAVAWAIEIAKDNSFHYGGCNQHSGSPRAKGGKMCSHKEGCYFCKTNKKRKSKNMLDREKTYCCNTFVTAAYAHGGGEPKMLEKCKDLDSYWVTDYPRSKIFKSLGNVSKSKLKKGDVLCYPTHVAMYIGDGKMVEAGHRDDNVKGSKSWNSSISVTKVRTSSKGTFRYIGNGGGDRQVVKAGQVSASSSTASVVGNGGTSKSSQDVISGAITWALAIAKDDEFHYGGCSIHGGSKPKGGKMCSHGNGCYFCGTNKGKSKNMANREKSYCCNPFVHAAFAHGGGEPTMLKLCKKGGSYGFALGDSPTYHTSKLFKNLGKVRKSKLVEGDVLCTGSHVKLYIGGGKVVEAGHRDDNVKGSKSWKDSIAVHSVGGYDRVYRYIGKGGGIMESVGSSSGAGGSSGPKFTKKNSMTVLETIDIKTGTRKKIRNGGTYDVAQSFAATSDGFAVAFVSAYANGPGEVRLYDRRGKYKAKKSGTIKHANGATVSPDNSFIVTGDLHSSAGAKFSIAGNTIGNQESVSFLRNTSGIAYDRDTQTYVVSEGPILLTTKDLKTKQKDLKRNMHGPWFGDICAANGYVFACHSLNKRGDNYVDIYNESNGDYCGSYKVCYGELESADVVNGELVLLVHIKGEEDNYIHFTGIQVGNSDGTGGFSPTNVVTQHDMDILSAYSISIANTALAFDEKGEKKTIGELIFSTRYTDINGKPVKTYWFGKDAGKINYEKDLKKKIKKRKAKFYRLEDAEITESGDDVRVTLKEAQAHKICKALFGVYPYAEYVNAQAKPVPLTAAEKKAAQKEAKAESEAIEETIISYDARDVDKSEWSLILVNNDNPLPNGYNSSVDLATVDASLTSYSDAQVDKRILSSLNKMMKDCKAKSGGTPLMISGYRTTAYQKRLYDKAENKKDTAKPGHSEHECGLAVDIVDKSNQALTKAQENTAVQKWLMANCQNYGFILRYPENRENTTEIIYEPWHYRYVGEKHAKEIMENNLCLEDYVGGAVVETTDDEFEKAVAGKTTNAEAIYSLSDTTISLLFTGMQERNAVSGTVMGGSGDFPLPMDSKWGWSSKFGRRWGRLHAGVDLSAPKGTPIYSTTDGEVTTAGYGAGYGNHVVVKTGNMSYTYAHMSKITAKKGHVSKGQKIGEVGNTGRSFGNHLHYEIHKNGVPVDPFPLFSKEIQDKMKNNKTSDFD